MSERKEIWARPRDQYGVFYAWNTEKPDTKRFIAYSTYQELLAEADALAEKATALAGEVDYFLSRYSSEDTDRGLEIRLEAYEDAATNYQIKRAKIEGEK